MKHRVPLSNIVCVIGLVFASTVAHAGKIPDVLVAAIEPGIEQAGMNIGWLDSETLVVSAPLKTDITYSRTSDQRVLQFNVVTREAKEVVNPGSVMCIDVASGIAVLEVGSNQRRYFPNSKAPLPEIKAYRWNRATKELDAAHVPEPLKSGLCALHFGLSKNSNVIALNQGDGYLSYNAALDRKEQYLTLERNDKSRTALDIRRGDVLDPFFEYLPFRKEYLLQPGRFVLGGVTVVSYDVPVTDQPVLTMSPTGTVSRGGSYRAAFEQAGLKNGGHVWPYAKGTLITIDSRPKDGGGIYRASGDSVERIWCSPTKVGFDPNCRFESLIKVSPDGCHVAFFAQGSDDPKAPLQHRPTLKILPLCK